MNTRSMIRRFVLACLIALLPGVVLAQKTEALKSIRQTEAKPLAKKLTRSEGKEGIVATLKYEQLPDMKKARVEHQIFPSGKGFVVVGGITENTQLASTAEIYENGQWKEIPMNDGHYSGYSVVLNDGRVMVGGGYNVNDVRNHLKQTEIYNPATKSFSAGPDMTIGRIQSRAIAIGKNVYVSGNSGGADNTLDYYNGTSFSAIGDMDGRSNPYLFSDKNGNVYSLSTLNEYGGDLGFYTDQDGDRCLRGDMYDVAEGKTYYYNYYFYAQWVPQPLPMDAHVSDYHYIENGINYYVVLTKNGEQYLLTEACPDEGKVYNYKSFNIPLVHPVTNEKMYYRNGVFVNSTKREFYLIGLSASSNETTVKLHIISYNYGNGNWTIASASGFTHNLLKASWTMLSDGRLACTGGNMYSSYDAQKFAYIFTPCTAGESEYSSIPTGTNELLYDNTREPEQDALYIYRNDGGFNAFFFKDIDHIEYSKTDTLGIEHDDYVVQEVYALDSVFRIPVSAIDSVAFVTPKTQYKKDVAYTTESDLWNYVIASDSVSWILLRSNTPESMIPSVGQKLVTINQSTLLPAGFAGKVASVRNTNQGILVSCENVELTELFDQYVCKVSAIADSEGDAVRRREIQASGNYHLPLPEPSITVQLTRDLGGIFDGTGTLGFSLKPKLDIRCFLSLIWNDTNFDCTIRGELETKISASIAGNATGHVDLPLGPVINLPIPNVPLMFLKVEDGIFVELQGSVELGLTFTSTNSIYMMAQYNSLEEGNRQLNLSFHNVKNKLEWEKLAGKFTFSTGIYAQDAINVLDGSLGSVGNRANIGYKYEIKAELDWKRFMDQVKSFTTPDKNYQKALRSFYNIIDKDVTTSKNLFVNGQGFVKAGKWQKTGTSEVSFGLGEGGLVPRFSKPTVRLMGENSDRVYIDAPMERNVLFSTKVGYDIYDSQSKLVKEWVRDSLYSGTDQTLTMGLEPLQAGQKYIAFPKTELFGLKMYAEPTDSFTTDKPKFEIPEKQLTVPSWNGTADVKILTNIPDIRFATTDKWLSCLWKPGKQVVTIYYDAMSANQTERKGTINVTAHNGDGKVLFTGSISVTQIQASLELSSTTFHIGVNGGANVVTITSSNVGNLSATTRENFIHPSVNGNTVSFTVDENTSTESRSGTIVVSGTLGSTKQKIERYISIDQDGTETGRVGEGLLTSGTAYVSLDANGPQYFEDGKRNGVGIDVPGINDPQNKTLGYTIDRGDILSYRSRGYETEGDGEWSKVEYSWDMAMDINKGDKKSLYNYKLEAGSVNVTKCYYQKNLETKQLELVNTITCSYTLKDFNSTSVWGIGNGGVLEFDSYVDSYDTETKLSDFINNVTYNEYGKKGNWSYSSGDLIEKKWADNHRNWYFDVKLYLTEGTPLLEPDKTLIQFEDGHSAYGTVRYSKNDLVSDITITSSADWITIDEAGGYFHVTVPNNTSQADRTGYVYLSGKLADGSTLTRTITVKQPYTRIWDDRWETSTSEKAELPSKEIQEMLESHGMALYTDDEPPAVNGVFEVKPAMLQYSSNPEGGQAGDVFEGSFVFSIESMVGGTPRARLGIYQSSDEYGPMPADEYVCYLGGSGNQFTISNIFTETDDNPLGTYTYTHITIVSGEVEGNTIKNLQYAQVFLDDNGKVEDVYISTDSDGVSTPTTWAPGKGWDEEEDDDGWDARRRSAFSSKRLLRPRH